MKLIRMCIHLPRKHDEDIIDEFANQDHDGRYFVITEMCAVCMADQLVKNGIEDLPVLDPFGVMKED